MAGGLSGGTLYITVGTWLSVTDPLFLNIKEEQDMTYIC